MNAKRERLTPNEEILASHLHLELQIMKSREASGDPLRASEYTVVLSREEYKRLCECALEGLRAKAVK